MTWSLSAAGHAITDAGKEYFAEAQKLEAELVAELKAVLANPKWGTTSSAFTGNTVTTALHEPTANAPEPPASDSSATATN